MLDTHCHLDDHHYTGEVENIIHNFLTAGISQVISVGCTNESSKNVVKLSNKYESVYCAVGVHPDDCDTYNEQELENLLINKNNKLVAVGEIGLDYFHNKENKDIQKIVFISQIKLANKYKLPIVIHCRDAFRDTLEILKQNKPEFGAVMHCYSGSLEFAKEIIKLGYYISFTGSVTFKNAKNLHEVVKNIPLESFFFETDSPYLTPEPNRGKINEPKNVLDVARFVADLLELPVDELIEITDNNAKNFFKI